MLLVSFASLAACGVIHDGHHHQATSYQSIHMEHFHPIPTYAKKEDMHYLEHPVSEGKTESKVEVHHGSKHEPGYAVAAIHSEIYGHHGGHKFVAAGGHSYEHDDHQEHQAEQHADVKQYEPAQYHGGYSEEVGQDEAHSQEEPSGHYQYSQEAAHEGDENASYYHEGQQGDEGAHGSYEQGHEESGEHY